MDRLKSWLSLSRAGNCLIISLASYTGYLLGRGESWLVALILSLSVALVAAFFFTLYTLHEIALRLNLRVNVPPLTLLESWRVGKNLRRSISRGPYISGAVRWL